MSENVQTALEGAWIVAVFFGLVFFTGAGATRLLLPGDWRRYTLLLTPIVGWSLLVLGLFVVNLAVGVRIGIYAMLLVATAVNAIALWAGKNGGSKGWDKDAKRRSAERVLPLALALGLVVLGMLPQVIQGSLGLLSLNSDEEIYYPSTTYLLAYPVIGGPHSLNETFLQGISLYGWAFQYTMGALSALTGSFPFHVYLPASYCLLGLSVPAWYLLFREVYGLGRNAASLASLLYSLIGLPLWFGAYGYGPQMASLVAIPAGTAAVIAALRGGGTRRMVLAGLLVAAGLTAYYRVIALQYLFTLAPVVVLEVVRARRFRPVATALAVAALAFVFGLPSHWHVAEHYLVQGAIREAEDIGGNWSEGWGIPNFQPLSVGLGTEAYEWVRDRDGTGPLAFLDPLLKPFATPLTWLILAVAGVGLVLSARAGPYPAAIFLGFAAYMALDRFVLDFKYGYFKLLAVAGPLAYGFVVLAGRELWVSLRSRLHGLRLGASLGIVATCILIVVVYLSYNSYQTVWFSAGGWGLSIPDGMAANLHQMGQTVEPGARVFIAGRFQYPAPVEWVESRKDHVFGMKSVSQLRNTWAKRVRGMAMAELLHADVYGWFDTHQVWRGYHRLRDDEDYDYYLLAPENDPRLEGLDPGDAVWSDGSLTLYRSRGVVRKAPWTLWKERGSLAITAANPLVAEVAPGALRTDGTAPQGSAAGGQGRLRIGLLAFSQTEAEVEMGGRVKRLTLEAGVNWYTTPTIDLPSSVVVRPMDSASLGAVSLRLLDPGPEGQDLVPEPVVKDDLYASSSVLRLENWLTDPFKGKGPGSL